MILAIRSDKPEAEIYLYDNDQVVAEYKWLAHRELARTLLSSCDQLLKNQSIGWDDVDGLVVYRGPGSFTGLRIGIVTVMSMAYSLGVPAVGSSDDDWLAAGAKRLLDGQSDQVIEPDYGAEPRITKARK